MTLNASSSRKSVAASGSSAAMRRRPVLQEHLEGAGQVPLRHPHGGAAPGRLIAARDRGGDERQPQPGGGMSTTGRPTPVASTTRVGIYQRRAPENVLHLFPAISG